MSKVRTVTVGFQAKNKMIERVIVDVPAEWIAGDRPAITEVFENARLPTRLSVVEQPLWVEISDPWDTSAISAFRVG